jgi:hypothetical protein
VPAQELHGVQMLHLSPHVLHHQYTIYIGAAWEFTFGVAPIFPTAVSAIQNLPRAMP